MKRTRSHAPQTSLQDLGDARPNLTPMTDVVFLLLVFFLVTMRFKSLDMKMEAELPKHIGPSPLIIEEMEETVKLVARLDRPSDGRARLRLNGQALGYTDDPAAWDALRGRTERARARHMALGGDPDDVEAEVDAAPLVRTSLVIRAIDTFAAADLTAVRFRGTPPPGR